MEDKGFKLTSRDGKYSVGYRSCSYCGNMIDEMETCSCGGGNVGYDPEEY